ncbi:MAG: dimethyl sulfoxide reductase anchor subunit [Cellulomonas sp.]|nr:dimethyl sulfoxide reductase anchor subunit [Cellulomonas sp.]
MHVAEWPLVVFTLLAQMSVGSFVVLGAVQLLARGKAGTAAVEKLSNPALYAIGPVMVLAMVASLFHLGSPLHAINVLNHLGSSWLSREILFGVLFAGLGAVFAACQWFGWLTPIARQVLAGVTALVGLVLVWVMSNVYLLPTVPAWDTVATPISFFTTTLLLGALAVGAAFVGLLTWRKSRNTEVDEQLIELVRSSLRVIGVASIVLVGVEFVVLPTYVLGLATSDQAAATQSAHALLVGGGVAFVVRLVLAFLGAGLLGFLLYRAASSRRDSMMFAIAVSAFALVLVSESIGRILFYDSLFRVGM